MVKIDLSLQNAYKWLFIVVLVAGFHLNNVTIAGIKIPELLMLGFTPFIPVLVKSVNKYIFYFFCFFLLLVLLTFCKNIFQTFYFDFSNVSVLKQPYFITISRFLEFLCCVVFVTFVYKLLLYLKERGFDIDNVLKKFLYLNILLSLYFILTFIFLKLNISLPGAKQFYYSTTRLRGFYLEGGPFGLMYAFLFCLSTLISGKNYFIKIIFLITVVLAQSKAGILMVMAWIFYGIYHRFPKKSLLRPLSLVAAIAGFIIIGYFVASNYVENIMNIQQEVLLRPNDTNLVMGRISGFFITPKMFFHNPILGVGMGNYSLVRNNPDYRGFFPPAEDWDLSGLGGLITLLAENGFLGLFLLSLLIFILYQQLRKTTPFADKLVLLFILPSLLGVQLYFVYIWFAIGYAIFLIPNQKTALPAS